MSEIMKDADDNEVEVLWVDVVSPEFKPRPIADCLDEPLDQDAEPRDLHGRPCLLYADMDYAEDWSGEYVREMHPYCLVLDAKPLSAAQFWALVRGVHGLDDT